MIGDHRRAPRVVHLTIVAWLAILSACSPVVGAQCRGDLAQCGSECVDLDHDSRHCGGCFLACDDGQSCVLGACVGYPADDGGVAAAGDAGTSEPDAGVGAGVDAAVDDDAGVVEVEGCDLGELSCDGACVRPDSDPRNCGACGVVCGEGEVCAGGACGGGCGAPRTTCGDRCVDLLRDPDHCGACGVECDSGVCAGGVCSSPVAGHVVLVGHDYEESRAGMSRVAGNAVFLGRGSPVRVLAFEGGATEASIAGTDAAIDQVALAIGRSWTRTVASSPEDVTLSLASADVFVLYAQAGASDLELFEWAKTWERALRTFLGAGGVVVVFDGMGENRGTYTALVHAQLIDAWGRYEATGRVLDVTSPADAVALDLPLRYRGERSTVRFETTEPPVVSDGASAVVVHRTIVP